MGEVKLCSKHYVELYKQLHPDHYKFNCMLCSVPIKASSSFRQCTAPAILQSHLEEHTGFTGVLTTKDKCYRYNLLVIKKEKTITNDEDFSQLIANTEKLLPDLPFSISNEGRLFEIGLLLTAISVAHDLQENRAMTLTANSWRTLTHYFRCANFNMSLFLTEHPGGCWDSYRLN